MTRRASWTYAAGLVALSLLLVRALFAVPYLPTNDGPEHVIAAHIENHFGDPGSFYPDVLRPTSEFAARGFTLIFSPLEASLGWQLGLQCALVITALTSAFGFAMLVRAVNPARWPLAFLGFPLALTWELYMGFFPFTVGSGVGLFVLALAVAWKEPTPVQRVVLASLLLLEAVCHVFTSVLTGLLLATLLVWRVRARGTTKDALRELAKVALMGLPAGAILVGSFLAGPAHGDIPFAENMLVLPLTETIAVFPRLVAPGPPWRTLLGLLALAGAIVFGANRVRKRDADATDRALFVAGAMFLLAGALLPMNIPGWQFFSPRFIPLGVLLCVVSVPVERVIRPFGFAATALGLFAASAAWLISSVAFHRRLAASCEDAILGLSAPVARSRVWLPITLAPEGGLSPYPELSEVPFLAPLRHLPMLYAVVEGGITPYTFANSAATYPFVAYAGGGDIPPAPAQLTYAPLIESEAFVADPLLRKRVVDELAIYGVRYEGILVLAARPEDLAAVRARGFVDDWAHGSTLIAHFVPCPLEVTIPPTGDVPRLTLEAGPREAPLIVRRYKALPAVAGSDGARHVSVPAAPCGPVRVRPHWEAAKDDGTLDQTFCGNAGSGGNLDATLTRTSTTVVCEAPFRASDTGAPR